MGKENMETCFVCGDYTIKEDVENSGNCYGKILCGPCRKELRKLQYNPFQFIIEQYEEALSKFAWRLKHALKVATGERDYVESIFGLNSGGKWGTTGLIKAVKKSVGVFEIDKINKDPLEILKNHLNSADCKRESKTKKQSKDIILRNILSEITEVIGREGNE